MNKVVSNICHHIVDVFESDGTHLDYGEVLNKFEHFVTNDALVMENYDTLERIYNKCISDNALMEFVVMKLYGKVNEGFYNPFLGDDEQTDVFDDDCIYIEREEPTKDVEIEQNDITVDDSCVNGKIYCKDGKMYSGVSIKTGDTIEVCPVMALDRESMCSRTVRDLSFLISASEDRYGIPLGYANIYRTSVDSKLPGNVDYEYPEMGDTMRFVAVSDIKPNDELILRIEEDPMCIR